MKKRIITGVLMAVIFIPLIILSGWFYTIFVAFLSYVAGYEVLNMMEKEEVRFKKLKYIAPLWNVLSILISALEPSLLLPALIIITLMNLSLSVIYKNFNIKSSMSLIFTYVYTGLSFSFIYSLRMPFSEGFFNLGLYVILFLAIIVMFTDMGALTFGLLFGKKKLCPEISPKKTVEGAIGGLVSGVVLGITFYYTISTFVTKTSILFINNVHPIVEVLIVLLLTLVLSIATQIGDLVASKLKRQYGIKDFGKIFPGHGGVLDRFDSMIVAGALFQALLAFLL